MKERALGRSWERVVAVSSRVGRETMVTLFLVIDLLFLDVRKLDFYWSEIYYNGQPSEENPTT